MTGLSTDLAGRRQPPPRPSPVTSLFLDFDGTLVELASRPEAVRVDNGLTTLLGRLALRRPGQVAVVSGRSLADLTDLLGPDLSRVLRLVGSHGVELAGVGLSPALQEGLSGLGPATAELAAIAMAHGFVFERKTYGAALHYRLTPHLAELAGEAAQAVARRHRLHLQAGKMMMEVRVPGDKGQALDRLMAEPLMAGTRPIFIGDDVTDEAGFVAAAQHGGAGVLVGEPRSSAAAYGLADVTAVRAWLLAAIEDAQAA